MLHLCGSPCWQHAGAAEPLPNTLPGWTLALLALRGEWVTREHLMALLWPDLPSAAAQHNLRTNLHRVRALLRGFGCEEALAAERSRVRLHLPLALGLEQEDAAPAQLLAGFLLPGFPALDEWLSLERTAHQKHWRDAQWKRCTQAPAQATGAAQRERFARALLAADPLDRAATQVLAQALREQGRAQEAALAEQAADAELRRGASVAVASMAAAPAPAPMAAASARHAFIGRRLERRHLLARLSAPPAALLTLLGPGGIGKSSLAAQALDDLRVATSVAPARHVWVDLHDLLRADDLSARVADRLGLAWDDRRDSAQTLAARIASARPPVALLVLDNAEHLQALATWLAVVRARAPALAMLVTSRQRLGLPGEEALALEGLPVPDDASTDADAAVAFDAVELFARHAQAVDPGFDLVAQMPHVVNIVRHVGGLPLAIKLAAAWVRVLRPELIAGHLGRSLALLRHSGPTAGHLPASRPEHANLQGLLEGTWQRLQDSERQAMQDLSIFEGSFDADAAEAVAGVALPALAGLVDEGLVTASADGRFSLHAVLRAHARQAACRHGPAAADEAGANALQLRHAQHFLRRMHAEWDAVMRQPWRGLWRRLEPDHADLCLAWATALAARRLDWLGPAAQVLQRAWLAAGRGREAAALLHAAVALPVQPERVLAHVQLHAALAGQLLANGDYRVGREIGLAGLALAARPPEVEAAAETMHGARVRCALAAAQCIGMLEDQAASSSELEALLAQARARSAAGESGVLAMNLGVSRKRSGRHDEARALYEAALRDLGIAGWTESQAMALYYLGALHLARKDWAAAATAFTETLRFCREQKVDRIVLYARFGSATAALELGRSAEALALLRACTQEAEAIDDPSLAMNAKIETVRAFAALGRLDDGLAQARDVLIRLRTHPGAKLHLEALRALGQLHARAGQPLQAARAWLVATAEPQIEVALLQTLQLELQALPLPPHALQALSSDLPSLQGYVNDVLAAGSDAHG